MTLKWDVRGWSDPDREAFAERIRVSPDFTLPALDIWNTALCRRHRIGWVEPYYEDGEDKKRVVTDRPKPGCRDCAIVFRRHQRVSVAWLYFRKRALLADTMGSGKAQPLDSLVLTPTGFTRMGDVKVGQEVVSPDGTITRVSGVFPQGKRDVYEVTFVDGRIVRADGEHLWTVSTYDARWWKRPPVQRTTLELLNTLTFKNGDSRWSVQTVSPVDLGSWKSSLDPYLVGSLLGDGGLTGGTVMFTTADAESVEELNRLLPTGYSLRPSDDRYTYRVSAGQTGGKPNPVTVELRRLGIMGHSAHSKFVPSELLNSRVEDRLALLQGLLDTDGSAAGAGYDFLSASEQLADDVTWLTRSLGGRASKHIKFVDGRAFHRVTGRLPVEFAPFRLQRKMDKLRVATKYPVTHLAIKRIEFVGSEEVQCIRVDSDLHEYVTDHFTRTHNTTSAGGLLAMMKQTGELNDPSVLTHGLPGVGRALIIPRSPALRQWQAELHRMMPTLNTQIAVGSPSERKQLYAQRWDALLIGPQMLTRDYKPLLDSYGRFSLVLTDDIDFLRNMDTNASRSIEAVGNMSDRVVVMTGTPLQKQLLELYAQLHPIGGEQLFGSPETFLSNHVRKEKVAERHPSSGLIIGFKHQTTYYNMDLLKKKIRPLYMRRTAADLEDVELPTINPNDVFLDLYPKQREAYRELQRGVVALMKDGELKQKQVHARAKLIYGAQICTGLAALGQPDDPLTSVKLDWVLDTIKRGGDLGDEKVVIFAQFKNTIRALHARLQGHDIGYATIWGEDNNMQRRQDEVDRFWRDDNCRVLVGTQAIEQSLNLQVARHLINLDMIMNPARMEQLAGRIRRDGSAFKNVFVHNLLTLDTQEERYLPLLEREAALAGYVWDESSELFNQLSPEAMLRLITG